MFLNKDYSRMGFITVNYEPLQDRGVPNCTRSHCWISDGKTSKTPGQKVAGSHYGYSEMTIIRFLA